MHNNSSDCNMTNVRYPLFKITYSLVLALGLPLNLTALWMFVRRIGLRKSVPVIYMTNLALSDLLFILTLPFRIMYFYMGCWTLGDVACMIPGTLFTVNIYSSSFFIMLVSVDRMLAVAYPLRSRHIRTQTVAWVSCLTVWLVTGAMAVPVALNHRSNFDNSCNVYRCFENYNEKNWPVIFYILCTATIVGVFIPFCIIVGCTVMVVRQLRGMAETSTETCTSSQRIVKMVWLLLSNLLIYAICFFPFHVVTILYALYKLKYLQYDYLTVQSITLCLASTNSCLDPLVFYFSTRNLQRKGSIDIQKREPRTSQSYYPISLKGVPNDEG
ncbi:lysophosphatidic acid receptor 6-like [Hoplias malabaricus]|uniref:lysophosphatidic acid receptor 6-like n=1 Tax=Hoplias malabaricus TaxID=27720 RepID=UPI003461A43D